MVDLFLLCIGESDTYGVQDLCERVSGGIAPGWSNGECSSGRAPATLLRVNVCRSPNVIATVGRDSQGPFPETTVAQNG